MFEAGKIVWAQQGLKGFGRGLVPRVVTFVPSNALSWVAYEGKSILISHCSRSQLRLTLLLNLYSRSPGFKVFLKDP